jgi:hypothetical protein
MAVAHKWCVAGRRRTNLASSEVADRPHKRVILSLSASWVSRGKRKYEAQYTGVYSAPCNSVPSRGVHCIRYGLLVMAEVARRTAASSRAQRLRVNAACQSVADKVEKAR